MNILLIAQCDKRALVESRRILDQFAERKGDRTWQTSITQAGLDTLRKLLRKTARRNTSVACHWIRGLDHSELLWIVGDRTRFSEEGTVPTNTTSRNVLRGRDENEFACLEDIKLLSGMASLMHDLGKATEAFIRRLQGKLEGKNIYRHEWVSLRLFQAFVGKDDDATWLARLADSDKFDESLWIGEDRLQRDGLDNVDEFPFRSLPPLAGAIAWLILTHHRIPVIPVFPDDIETGKQKHLGARSKKWQKQWLVNPLSLVSHNWNEVNSDVAERDREIYWKMAGALPVVEPMWRAHAARLAKGLQKLLRSSNSWLDRPYVMHLSRLCLMLSDHHYSSLDRNSPLRVPSDGRTRLFANTDEIGNKQPLDEHLMGVASGATAIAHALPGFESHLPALRRLRELRKRVSTPKFQWQNVAFDAAISIRDSANDNGAFVVNMASTGCGKTLANLKILYGLANESVGFRATYALGLRTLTRQTGEAYREALRLSDDELAVLVGGSASKELDEYHEEKAQLKGSESSQPLMDEATHVMFEGNLENHPLLARAMGNGKIQRMLSAPIVVCTVDHLTPATESLRGGHQIAPMLRMMSSAVILDELDDYDVDDLPALTRLVHWAGMLGSRVLISSATLPPALVVGMYQAYLAGREIFVASRSDVIRTSNIPCLWVDEFSAHSHFPVSAKDFYDSHANFINARVGQLEQQPAAKQGMIVPIDGNVSSEPQIAVNLASTLHREILDSHKQHAQRDPHSGKQISFGVVRMANIDPLFDVALQLFASDCPADVRIHLCVYHARMPLIQRSAIENLLDTAFNRKGDDQVVFSREVIRRAIDSFPERNQIFVVLASPVCEVGRDWDADWAIAEPSSMRSIIQLAGRVQRHRNQIPEHPNIRILETNVKSLKNPGGTSATYSHPGYESTHNSLNSNEDGGFLLRSHRLSEILQASEYQVVTAIPRISDAGLSIAIGDSLVALEQARTQASMHVKVSGESALKTYEATAARLFPNASLTGVLQQQQPFRAQAVQQFQLVVLPDDSEERTRFLRVGQERVQGRRREFYSDVGGSLVGMPQVTMGNGTCAWGAFDLAQLIGEFAEIMNKDYEWTAKRFATVDVPSSDQGWLYHPLLGFRRKRA